MYWLVVDLPFWKIWVRQLGWWNSQYMEKQNHVPSHQNQCNILTYVWNKKIWWYQWYPHKFIAFHSSTAFWHMFKPLKNAFHSDCNAMKPPPRKWPKKSANASRDLHFVGQSLATTSPPGARRRAMVFFIALHGEVPKGLDHFSIF